MLSPRSVLHLCRHAQLKSGAREGRALRKDPLVQDSPPPAPISLTATAAGALRASALPPRTHSGPLCAAVQPCRFTRAQASLYTPRLDTRSADGGAAALLHARVPAALHHDVRGVKHLGMGSSVGGGKQSERGCPPIECSGRQAEQGRHPAAAGAPCRCLDLQRCIIRSLSAAACPAPPTCVWSECACATTSTLL